MKIHQRKEKISLFAILLTLTALCSASLSADSNWTPNFPSTKMYRGDQLIINVLSSYTGSGATTFTSVPTPTSYLKINDAWGSANDREIDSTKTGCSVMERTKFDWNVALICEDTTLIYVKTQIDGYESDLSKTLTIPNAKKCFTLSTSKALMTIFVGCTQASTQVEQGDLSQTPDNLVIHAVDVASFTIKDSLIIATPGFTADFTISALDINQTVSVMILKNDMTTLTGWQTQYQGVKFVQTPALKVDTDTFVTTAALGTIVQINAKNANNLYFVTSVKQDATTLSVVKCTPTSALVQGKRPYNCQASMQVLTYQGGAALVSIYENFRYKQYTDIIVSTPQSLTAGSIKAGKFVAAVNTLNFEVAFDTPVNAYWYRNQLQVMGSKGTEYFLVQADTVSRGITTLKMDKINPQDHTKILINLNYFYHDIGMFYALHNDQNKGQIYFTYMRSPNAMFRPNTIPDEQKSFTFGLSTTTTKGQVDSAPQIKIDVTRDFQSTLKVDDIIAESGYAGGRFTIPTTPYTVHGNFMEVTEVKTELTDTTTVMEIESKNLINVSLDKILTERQFQDLIPIKNSKNMYIFKNCIVNGKATIQMVECFDLVGGHMSCNVITKQTIDLSPKKMFNLSQTPQSQEVIRAFKFYHYLFVITRTFGQGKPGSSKAIIIDLATFKVTNNTPIAETLSADFKVFDNSGDVICYTASKTASGEFKLFNLSFTVSFTPIISSLKAVNLIDYPEKFCPINLEFFPDSNDFVLGSYCDPEQPIREAQVRIFQIKIWLDEGYNTASIRGRYYSRGSKQQSFCLTSRGNIHILGLFGSDTNHLMRTVKLAENGSDSFLKIAYPLTEYKAISNGLFMTCNARSDTVHILAADPDDKLYVFNLHVNFLRGPWKRVPTVFYFPGKITDIKSIATLNLLSAPGQVGIFALTSPNVLTSGIGFKTVTNTFNIQIDATKVTAAAKGLTKTIQVANSDGKNKISKSFKFDLIVPKTKATVTFKKKKMDIKDKNGSQYFRLDDFFEVKGPISQFKYSPSDTSASNTNKVLPKIYKSPENFFKKIIGANSFVVSDDGYTVLTWNESKGVTISRLTKTKTSTSTSTMTFGNFQGSEVMEAGFGMSQGKQIAYFASKVTTQLQQGSVTFWIIHQNIVKSQYSFEIVQVKTNTDNLTENITSLKMITLDESKGKSAVVYTTSNNPYAVNVFGVTFTKDGTTATATSTPKFSSSNIMRITDFSTTYTNGVLYVACIIGNIKGINFYSIGIEGGVPTKITGISRIPPGEKQGKNLNLVKSRISCRPHPDATKKDLQCFLGTKDMYSYEIIAAIDPTTPSKVTGCSVGARYKNPPHYYPMKIQAQGSTLMYYGYRNQAVEISSENASSILSGDTIATLYDMSVKTEDPFTYIGQSRLGISFKTLGRGSVNLIASRQIPGVDYPIKPKASLFFNSPDFANAMINEYPVIDSPYFLVNDASKLSSKDKLMVDDLSSTSINFDYSVIANIEKSSGGGGFWKYFFILLLLAAIGGGVYYYLQVYKPKMDAEKGGEYQQPNEVAKQSDEFNSENYA